MQFYNLQFRYRTHWIAAEKRETRALYWPRSPPRQRVQHLAVAKYMEKKLNPFLPQQFLLLLLSFLGLSLPPLVFLIVPFEFAPSTRDRPVRSQLPEEDICGCDSALTLKRNERRERKRETRRRETTNRKGKLTATTDRHTGCPILTNDRFFWNFLNFDTWNYFSRIL